MATSGEASEQAGGEIRFGHHNCDTLCDLTMLYRPTEHHAMKTYWGSRGIALHILYLGTRWRWVVCFIPRPLYPHGKSQWL